MNYKNTLLQLHALIVGPVDFWQPMQSNIVDKESNVLFFLCIGVDNAFSTNQNLFLSLLLFIPVDVLNTLMDHGTDYVGQAEEEEDADIYVSEAENMAETDIEEEDEEGLDKEEQKHTVDLPSISILHNSYTDNHRASTFSTISTVSTVSSASKDSMFSTMSAASESYSHSLFSVSSGVDSGYFEEYDDYICSSPVSEKCSPKSIKSPARLSQHIYKFFSKSPRSLCRAKSLGNTEAKDLLLVREKRSYSLPQQVKLHSPEPPLQPQSQTLRHVCFRRRPILSSEEDSKNTTLRVVVFGADHVAGKVARAYNSLRRRESTCPHLSRVFNLQFYFVPVRRDSAGGHNSLRAPCPVVQTGATKGATLPNVRTGPVTHLGVGGGVGGLFGSHFS